MVVYYNLEICDIRFNLKFTSEYLIHSAYQAYAMINSLALLDKALHIDISLFNWHLFCHNLDLFSICLINLVASV